MNYIQAASSTTHLSSFPDRQPLASPAYSRFVILHGPFKLQSILSHLCSPIGPLPNCTATKGRKQHWLSTDRTGLGRLVLSPCFRPLPRARRVRTAEKPQATTAIANVWIWRRSSLDLSVVSPCTRNMSSNQSVSLTILVLDLNHQTNFR